jgi:hypothetical protein
MRRRYAVLVAALVAVLGMTSVGLAVADDDTRSSERGKGKASRFVGYWMGTDPVDGGDSRRGFTRNPDGTISLAGRDSYLTLCDGTDRGFASFSDGVVRGSVLTTDNLVLQCFNNGATVTLHARYELIEANIVREIVTTPAGDPVTEVLFHRVSED